MADKLTLLELHLHSEDNEFTSDVQFSSDIGDLLRRRLGFGSASDEETDVEGTEEDEQSGLGAELKSEVEERTPIEATADGGDTVQVDEEEESEGSGAVVEIDADADLDEDDDDSSGGRSKTKMLFVLLLLVGIALFAKRYLGGDDIEDEFEEL